MTWRHLMPWLWAVTTVLGIFLLIWVLRRYDPAELRSAILSFPVSRLVPAALFAAGSFACLWAAEILAARYAGLGVSPGRNAVVVVAALGIGHSIGFAAFSSGAVRLRMYGRSGVAPAAVARMILFAGITVGFGLALTAFWATLARPGVVAGMVGVRPVIALSIAGVAPVLALLYVTACWLFPAATLRLWRMSLHMPPAPLAAAQLLVGTLNFSCVAAAVYFCLAPFVQAGAQAGYPAIAAVYVGANAAALVGHVPGGWGVLEYGVSTFLSGPRLMAGVLVFRIVYYLVPLLAGLGILLADELHGRWGAERRREAPLLRSR